MPEQPAAAHPAAAEQVRSVGVGLRVCQRVGGGEDAARDPLTFVKSLLEVHADVWLRGRAALLAEAREDGLSLARQRCQIDEHGDHPALGLVLVMVHELEGPTCAKAECAR